jgi:hypothetical protein
MTRTAMRFEVARGQQAAGVGAYQVRPVAPLADEVAVIPAALEHHMGKAERQRAVGARPHPKPEIGLPGEAHVAGINDDQPHVALQRRDRRGCVGDAGEAGVVAPQEQHAAVLDIRHGAHATGADTADAISVAGGEGAPPAAEVHGDARVRGADGVRQPLDEAGGIRDRGGGGGSQGEDNRLRLILVRDPAQGGGGQIECLVPANPFPAGIGVALRAGAPQWMGQPLRMIDQFRRRPPLGAERLPGRMRGIRVQPGEAALFDRRHRATAGDAEAAIAVDTLRAGMLSHAIVLRSAYR